MRMANRYLLYRAGRDQFGDTNRDPAIESYIYRDKDVVSAYEKKRIAWCRKLDKEFKKQYAPQWLGKFHGKTKKEAWADLYPNQKPSISTFYTKSSAFRSLDEYLLHILLTDKWLALINLGYSR